MKTLKMFFILFSVIIFFGCQEKILVEPDDAPVTDGKIQIQVSTLYKTSSGSDTVQTEKYLRTSYNAIAKNGINIVTWQWTFQENNFKSSNASVEFWHSLDPGAITLVTLVGIDDKGQSHSTSVFVKIVNSLDGLPGFALVSCTSTGASNLYNLVFIAHKKGLLGINGSAYGYSGSVTSPTWTVKTIAPADTNSNYVNGAVVPANAGDIGKFVVIRVTLSPGDYQLPVGKIASSNGNLIWGSFWGNYKDNKFTLTSSGNVTGITTANAPGSMGDEGVNAVVRIDVDSSSVTVYTRHASAFTSGFVRLQNANGTWREPLAETAVNGFPNWGKIKINFTQFPISDLLVFQFGPNISSPTTYSPNMSGSSYWDNAFQYLKVKVVPVLGKKTN